jgi:hypothetical protein
MLAIYDSCDGCSHSVQLTPTNLLVAVAAPDGTGQTPELLFGCTSCGFATRRVVEWRRAMAFVSAGANVLSGISLVPPTPAEFADPVRADHRPLTLDDLLDLHEELAQDNWHEPRG